MAGDLAIEQVDDEYENSEIRYVKAYEGSPEAALLREGLEVMMMMVLKMKMLKIRFRETSGLYTLSRGDWIDDDDDGSPV